MIWQKLFESHDIRCFKANINYIIGNTDVKQKHSYQTRLNSESKSIFESVCTRKAINRVEYRHLHSTLRVESVVIQIFEWSEIRKQNCTLKMTFNFKLVSP